MSTAARYGAMGARFASGLTSSSKWYDRRGDSFESKHSSKIGRPLGSDLRIKKGILGGDRPVVPGNPRGAADRALHPRQDQLRLERVVARAVPQRTILVGVQIRDMTDASSSATVRTRSCAGPPSSHQTSRALWTRGYIPRLRTNPGREVPNPLTVEIRQGSADIEQVMKDVMSLIKLNFNGAGYCDGLPVTLRFCRSGGRNSHCGALRGVSFRDGWLGTMERRGESEGSARVQGAPGFRFPDQRVRGNNAMRRPPLAASLFCVRRCDIAGRQTIRDAIFLAYGTSVPTQLSGCVDDLLIVLKGFATMAGAYCSLRVGQGRLDGVRRRPRPQEGHLRFAKDVW
jgi:hypothetical protein